MAGALEGVASPDADARSAAVKQHAALDADVATLVDDFIFSPGDSSFSFALVVPEPGTGPLLGCAIAGLLAARRRTPRRAPGPASA